MGDKKFLMVMDNDYFLDLLTKKNEDKAEANYQDPKMKYAFQNAKNALTTAMKYLIWEVIHVFEQLDVLYVLNSYFQ